MFQLFLHLDLVYKRLLFWASVAIDNILSVLVYGG